MMILDRDLAGRFARLTLGHLRREYPHKLDHVLNGPADARTPSELHPIFYGSFDWHSCVHGWWQVLVLLRRFPDLPEAAAIAALADDSFTAEKVAGELAYLETASPGFERPYGLAWLIMLQGELARHKTRPWGAALDPLSLTAAKRLRRYGEALPYPIRDGAHANTAFWLNLVRLVVSDGWSVAVLLREIEALLEAVPVRRWYGDDQDEPAREPGGDSFLSPALVEALLMSRVLSPDEFRPWFDRFLPRAAKREPGTLFEPAVVPDRSDSKLAHLDGVNFSRAWCWRGIAKALGPRHPVTPLALETAERHLAASLPHIEDDYMGSHWLASFALLAVGVE